MPLKGAKFVFLTMAEFNKLERRAKSVYLERAVAAVVEEFGDSTEQSLFTDGPPASPARGKGIKP
jgi:hypothetical protein